MFLVLLPTRTVSIGVGRTFVTTCLFVCQFVRNITKNEWSQSVKTWCREWPYGIYTKSEPREEGAAAGARAPNSDWGGQCPELWSGLNVPYTTKFLESFHQRPPIYASECTKFVLCRGYAPDPAESSQFQDYARALWSLDLWTFDFRSLSWCPIL